MAATDGLHYNVEVRSRFAAFADDDSLDQDPSLFLSQLKESRAEKKRDKKNNKVKPEPIVQVAAPVEEAVAPEVEVKPQEEQPAVHFARESDRGRSYAPRPYRGGTPGGYNRGPRGGGRPPFRPQHFEEDAVQQNPGEFDQRGRGRGRGGFINRGRGRGTPRYSGRQPAQEEEFNQVEEPVPVEETVEQPIEQPEEAKPEEPVSLTLKEYKAKLSASKAPVELATKAARAPNDGKDVFANMVAREKPAQDNVTVQPQPARQNVTVDPFPIAVTFGRGRPHERGRGDFRGGRGMRGQPRGRGRFQESNRGAPIMERRMPPPPAIHDDAEFPVLK